MMILMISITAILYKLVSGSAFIESETLSCTDWVYDLESTEPKNVSCYDKLICGSVFIQSTDLSCEIQLSDGCYEDFELVLPLFHLCVSPYSDNEFKFVLKNYSLPAFPNGTFSHLGSVHSFKLIIEENSHLEILFPNLPDFSLFSNTWYDSVVFHVSDLSEMTGWRWTTLFDLKVSGGLEFNAIRSNLLYLHSDFGRVANGRIVAVRILKCHLRWLGKNVFAPLSSLKTLELRDNLLEIIERSHLPTYAPELKILDLGNNKLTHLPFGIIDGLNLTSIFLEGNNIKITEAQTQDILSAKSFPLLRGVLWPCFCGAFSKDKGKLQLLENDECYSDNDILKIHSYQETCNDQA